jgi:nucleoside-diphosphate-sugar epimerase
MKILIIGGTSFIGLSLTKQLAKTGHDVTVFNRGSKLQNIPEGVKHIKGDRNELEKHKTEFEALKPDVVIDMVCIFESQAKALVDAFKGITDRIILISSCDVYRAYGRLLGTEPGEPDAVPLTEESPLREKFYPYKKAEEEGRLDKYDKILCERVLMNDKDVKWTILRLPMVYGQNDYQYRFFNYLKRMDDNRPYILLDEATAKWKGCRGYVDNVAFAIKLAVENNNSINQIYNVSEENTDAEYDWVKRIAKYTGWKGQILITPPQNGQSDENQSQDLDTSSKKIRQQLSYYEPISEEEAYINTIKWELSNPPKQIQPEQFNYAEEDKIVAELKTAE